MTPAELDSFIARQERMSARIARKAARARTVAKSYGRALDSAGPRWSDRIVAAIDRPGLIASERPRSRDGAVSFHFRLTTLSRSAPRDGGSGAGRAEAHMRYLERPGAVEKVPRREGAGAGLEPARAEGAQAYIERPGAAEMAGAEVASFGNIGVDRADRLAFWRAVEGAAARPSSCGLDIHLDRDAPFWDCVRGDAEAPPALRRACGVPVHHEPSPDAGPATRASALPDGTRRPRASQARGGGVRVSYAEAEAIEAYARAHMAPSAASDGGPAVRVQPGRGGRIQSRLVVELPHELTPEARLALVRDLTHRLFVAGRGAAALPYWAVIHAPDGHNDHRNFHAHIAFSERPARRMTDPSTGRAVWDCEVVETTVDRHGHRRIRRPHEQATDRAMHRRAWVGDARRLYAELANASLRRAGVAKRYDPRSYAEMGVDAVPLRHIPPAAYALEKKGRATAAGEALVREQWRRLEHGLAAAHDAPAGDAAELRDFEREYLRWSGSGAGSVVAEQLAVHARVFDFARALRRIARAERAAHGAVRARVQSRLTPPLGRDAKASAACATFVGQFASESVGWMLADALLAQLETAALRALAEAKGRQVDGAEPLAVMPRLEKHVDDVLRSTTHDAGLATVLRATLAMASWAVPDTLAATAASEMEKKDDGQRQSDGRSGGARRARDPGLGRDQSDEDGRQRCDAPGADRPTAERKRSAVDDRPHPENAAGRPRAAEGAAAGDHAGGVRPAPARRGATRAAAAADPGLDQALSAVGAALSEAASAREARDRAALDFAWHDISGRIGASPELAEEVRRQVSALVGLVTPFRTPNRDGRSATAGQPAEGRSAADPELDRMLDAIAEARADTDQAREARERAALDFARHDISAHVAASPELAGEVRRQVSALVGLMTPSRAPRTDGRPVTDGQAVEGRSAADTELNRMLDAIAEARADTDQAREARERAALDFARHDISARVAVSPELAEELRRQVSALVGLVVPSRAPRTDGRPVTAGQPVEDRSAADPELDRMLDAIRGMRADTDQAREARERAALDFARHDISARVAASPELAEEVQRQVSALVELLTPFKAPHAEGWPKAPHAEGWPTATAQPIGAGSTPDPDLDRVLDAIAEARADTDLARAARERAAFDLARHDLSMRIGASSELAEELQRQASALVELMTSSQAQHTEGRPATPAQSIEGRSAPDPELDQVLDAIAEARADTDQARAARERAVVDLSMHDLHPLLTAASALVQNLELQVQTLSRSTKLSVFPSTVADAHPRSPDLAGRPTPTATGVGRVDAAVAAPKAPSSTAAPQDIDGAAKERGLGLGGIRYRVSAALELARGLGRALRGSVRDGLPADASSLTGPATVTAQPVEGRRAADPEPARALSAPAAVRADAAPAHDTRERAGPAPAPYGVERRTAAALEPAHQIGGQAPMTVHLGTLSDALDAYAKAIEAWEAREAREREDADVVEARRKAQEVARAVMAMAAERSLADRQQVGRLHARGEALDGVWKQARARSGRGKTAGSEQRAPLPEFPIPAPTAAAPQRWNPGVIAPARRPLAGLLAYYLRKHGQDGAYADRIADLKRAVGSDAELLAAWLVRMAASTQETGPASKSAELIVRVVGWSAALMDVHTRRPDAQLVERAYAEVMGVGQKPAPVRRRAVAPSVRRGKERGRGYGD